MKKTFYSAIFLSSALLFACDDDGDTTTTTTDTSTTTTTEVGMDTAASSTTSLNTGSPFKGADSTFVMEAASGGLMEVEAGTLAQQNASNERVKAFAAMMVRDHSKANEELKALASSRGTMLPDSMMKKHRDHIQMMQKMTGKAFDKHYMSMMVTDHKEDVSKFENASKKATDADLKAWAGKTLPVLVMHRDSAIAINKMKF